MKRVIIITALLLCVISLSVSASSRFYDDTGVFTDEQKEILEEYYLQKCEETGADVLFVMTGSTGGDFDGAEENYLKNGDWRSDTVMFFLSLDDKLYDTVLCGAFNERFDADAASALSDVLMTDYLKEGKYEEGARFFVDEWILAFKDEPSIPVNAASESLPLDGEEEYDTTPAPDGALVIDRAHLLSDEEKEALEAYAREIGEKYGISVVVLTEGSIGYNYVGTYADDYYDGHGYLPEGALLLINMEGRDWYISTNGERVNKSVGKKYEAIGEHMIDAGLSSGDYYAAFSRYIKDVDKYLTYAKYGSPLTAVISIVIGLIVGLIVRAVLMGQLKSVRKKTEANAYVKNDGVRITQSNDVFLYKNVSRTERQSSSSSGGSRSGGGGGGGHGGGGGKF